MAKPIEDTVLINICIFTTIVKAFQGHRSQVGVCTYKVSRGEFWWQLNQDDNGSKAEADEGLQEAPGVQNDFNLMEICFFGFLAKSAGEYLADIYYLSGGSASRRVRSSRGEQHHALERRYLWTT